MTEYNLKGIKKIEEKVVNIYTKIENSFTSRYKKIENAFVQKFLEKKEN